MSCLATRFGCYVNLTDREKTVLAELESPSYHLEKGDILYHEGDQISELFIVRSGCLITSTMVAAGERQMLQMHFPGSIAGTVSIAFEAATATVEAITSVQFSRILRQKLGEVFAAEPRLAALFYAVAILEQVSLCDRLKSLGRTQGKARLAHLLLTVFSQLRTAYDKHTTQTKLPLKQVEIADAVGLTPVYVNRVLAQLEEEGYIARQGKIIRLVDEQGLADLCEFKDRFSKIDTSWFPQASFDHEAVSNRYLQMT